MKNIILFFYSLFLCILVNNLTAQTNGLGGPNDISINELMASNTATVADNAGDFDDWIEIYNNGSTSVDLSGWHLSDDPTRLDKWTFPDGLVIGAGGYRIIWADEDGSQGDLHANFKLSAGGETLMLSDSNNVLIDEITFSQQTTDMGFARVPNGTGNFAIQGPTYGAHNEWTVSADEIEPAVEFTIVPNPANDFINISTGEQDEQRLRAFNVLGQLQTEVNFLTNTTLDISTWTSGTYYLQIGSTTKKVIKQ